MDKSETYVIQDDVSRYGLRRMHLMRKVKYGEEEVEKLLNEMEGESPARMTTAYATTWQDEVGNWHLFMAWREMMETMYVASGKFCEALVQATRGYMRRFGNLPDRVIVREGTEAPELVQLEGDGRSQRAVVKRCGWMRKGDVGVYVEAGGPADGADCRLEMQERARDRGGREDGERGGEPAAVQGGADEPSPRPSPKGRGGKRGRGDGGGGRDGQGRQVQHLRAGADLGAVIYPP